MQSQFEFGCRATSTTINHRTKLHLLYSMLHTHTLALAYFWDGKQPRDSFLPLLLQNDRGVRGDEDSARAKAVSAESFAQVTRIQSVNVYICNFLCVGCCMFMFVCMNKRLRICVPPTASSVKPQ